MDSVKEVLVRIGRYARRELDKEIPRHIQDDPSTPVLASGSPYDDESAVEITVGDFQVLAALAAHAPSEGEGEPVLSKEDVEHIRRCELEEIADGAYGGHPLTILAARDRLRAKIESDPDTGTDAAPLPARVSGNEVEQRALADDLKSLRRSMSNAATVHEETSFREQLQRKLLRNVEAIIAALSSASSPSIGDIGVTSSPASPPTVTQEPSRESQGGGEA